MSNVWRPSVYAPVNRALRVMYTDGDKAFAYKADDDSWRDAHTHGVIEAPFIWTGIEKDITRCRD